MRLRRDGRKSARVRRPDKLLFPETGLSKGDLADYYERIHPRMRPQLAERPLVMERYPDGIAEEGFYQKEVGRHFPDWISTVRVPRKRGGSQRLLVADRKATLVYLVDQACVTPHLWLSRRDRLDVPDQLVIDLDPARDDFAPVRRAALQCRQLLDELGLYSVVKTTGSRGLHVHVPLRREEGFDAVRGFARTLAALLARRHPGELTTAARKAARRGRLYLDVARNAYAQTVVAPYAVRAREGAPVAAPIPWQDVEGSRLNARSFSVREVRRLLERDDPWAGLGRHARGLPGPRERLAELTDER
jgi:bifunctional non-homologous end joining protein LigD